MDLYYGGPYGLVLWGSTHKTYIKTLQIMQNKAIRIVNGSKYNDSVAPIYRSLNILPLYDLHYLQLCKFMFLNSRGELPGKLLSLFSPNTTMHSYITRHSEDPHVTNRITSLVSKSFIHVAPQM